MVSRLVVDITGMTVWPLGYKESSDPEKKGERLESSIERKDRCFGKGGDLHMTTSCYFRELPT